MALKEDVLAALAAVKSPDGAPLTGTGKLSDVVVSDGKVFFSITVDAAVVQAWEPVRKAAEAAVKAALHLMRTARSCSSIRSRAHGLSNRSGLVPYSEASTMIWVACGCREPAAGKPSSRDSSGWSMTEPGAEAM